MDDGVREEGSNSPNDSVISGRRRGVDGQVQIGLADGSSFFVSTEFDDTRQLSIGSEVSPELRRVLIIEDERIRAYAKALELLGRREHTVFELRMKLKKREFSDVPVEDAMRSLQNAGYLSDRRYAESWVENRLKRRPEGYPKLAAGLKKRGVDQTTIASVLDRLYTEEASERALEQAAAKIMRQRKIDELTALRKLTAKGFPYRRAKTHLRKTYFAE